MPIIFYFPMKNCKIKFSKKQTKNTEKYDKQSKKIHKMTDIIAI